MIVTSGNELRFMPAVIAARASSSVPGVRPSFRRSGAKIPTEKRAPRVDMSKKRAAAIGFKTQAGCRKETTRGV